MGLDIYVGPLTRYYAGAWETPIQRLGREHGIPVTIVRDGGDPPPISTETSRDMVTSWRAEIERQLGDALGGPLDWAESGDGDYVTERPEWDGHGAVRLIAAHEEFPAMTLPRRVPADIEATALWDLVSYRQAYQPGILRRIIGRLTGRSPKQPEPGPFDHILFPELWLPAPFDVVFAAVDARGAWRPFGSVPLVRRQLEELNARVFGADDTTLDAWRETGTDEPTFDESARSGLAVWLTMARAADDRWLPMILDY